MKLNRLYGVWQVDLILPCPIGTGIGWGIIKNNFLKDKGNEKKNIYPIYLAYDSSCFITMFANISG
jgi:hypothetical protein